MMKEMNNSSYSLRYAKNWGLFRKNCQMIVFLPDIMILKFEKVLNSSSNTNHNVSLMIPTVNESGLCAYSKDHSFAIIL